MMRWRRHWEYSDSQCTRAISWVIRVVVGHRKSQLKCIWNMIIKCYGKLDCLMINYDMIMQCGSLYLQLQIDMK